MARRVGVGLAGCGHWGRNVARNLHNLGCLTSICDVRSEVLQAARSEHHGVHTTRNFARLLADPGVQAVALAVPASLHYDLCKRALEAGKDVFVEKPLALDVAHAEELVQLAHRQRRILMVGHLLEYHPAVLKLKELIDGGDLGELHYLYSNRANLGRVRREENILWSFAPHDISVLLLLTGQSPEWVQTSGQVYLQPDVVDVTMTCLGFPGNTRAHVFVSWLHPFKEQKLVVIGSRKMAVFDDVTTEGKLRLFDKGIEWKNGSPVVRTTSETALYFAQTEPLHEELAHFLHCVQTRTPPRTDGASGLRVLRVLAACQHSLEQGGQVVTVADGAREQAQPLAAASPSTRGPGPAGAPGHTKGTT